MLKIIRESEPPKPSTKVSSSAELPVIGPRGGADETLVAGMVLSGQAWAAEEGVGGVLLRDAVHVVDGTPRVLSRYPSTIG